MAPAPEITVIVPTYRRPALLRACLQSLRDQDVDSGRYEVVVVDDASGPDVARVVEEAAAEWPGLRSLAQPNNMGPAAARNRAVSVARGRLLLFVDDDIAATEGLIATHLRLHERGDSTLGVVGLVRWHPDLHVTAFMRWLDTTSHQFAYGTWMKEGVIDRPWEAFYTCNLSMDRGLFESVGGFDETFPYAACEDTELGYRLWQRGFRLEYRPAALAWNLRPITLDDFRRRMQRAGESLVVLQQLQPDLPPVGSGEASGNGAAAGRARKALGVLARPGRIDQARAWRYQRLVARAYEAGMQRRGPAPRP